MSIRIYVCIYVHIVYCICQKHGVSRVPSVTDRDSKVLVGLLVHTIDKENGCIKPYYAIRPQFKVIGKKF